MQAQKCEFSVFSKNANKKEHALEIDDAGITNASPEKKMWVVKPSEFTVISKSQTHPTHQINKKRTKFLFSAIVGVARCVDAPQKAMQDAMKTVVNQTIHETSYTHMILTELSENFAVQCAIGATVFVRVA